jgi:hypothetical protein
MTAPDFEISTTLRARKLTSHVPPDGKTDTEGVTVERHRKRKGLPEKMRPGGLYEDVTVNKRVIARIATSQAADTKVRLASGKRIRRG